MIGELRLAVRWGVARQYLKTPGQWDCNFCESKKDLKTTRNCNWEQPGTCQKCGDVKFEDVIEDAETSNFMCPICNHRVRFKGEFQLGKSYKTPGCPISKLTHRAAFLLDLVEWSDKTGKLPTASTLFDESMFFYEVRSFITSERAVVEQELTPKDKDK